MKFNRLSKRFCNRFYKYPSKLSNVFKANNYDWKIITFVNAYFPNNKIEFTATSESVYEYLWLLEREFIADNFTDIQLTKLIGNLEKFVNKLKLIQHCKKK